MSAREQASIRMSPEFHDTAMSYYFQMRSGIHIIMGNDWDDKWLSLRDDIRLSIMNDANALAMAHLHRGQVYEPEWLDIALRNIADSPVVNFIPQMDGLKFRVLQEPSVFVCVRKREGNLQLQICTILKAILKQMNAPFAIARIDSILDPDGFPDRISSYLEQTHQALGIFSLFCGQGFPARNLPRVMFTNVEACVETKSMAHAQTVFLILHELAHIALGHLDEGTPYYPELFEPPAWMEMDGKPVAMTRHLRQEIEADVWAFVQLMEIDLGGNIDIDLKLRSVGLLLGYLKVLETMSTAIYDPSERRMVGTTAPIETSVREVCFIRQFGSLWTTEGEAAAFRLFSMIVANFPDWLANGDMRVFERVMTEPH